jgi:hypothetical protein
MHGGSTPASSGWDTLLSYPPKPNQSCHKTHTTSFELLRDGTIAWGRFQAEEVDHIRTDELVTFPLLDATVVLGSNIDQDNNLAL